MLFVSGFFDKCSMPAKPGLLSAVPQELILFRNSICKWRCLDFSREHSRLLFLLLFSRVFEGSRCDKRFLFFLICATPYFQGKKASKGKKTLQELQGLKRVYFIHWPCTFFRKFRNKMDIF